MTLHWQNIPPATNSPFLTLAIYLLWPLVPFYRTAGCHPWRHFTSSLCWECFKHSFSSGTFSRFSYTVCPLFAESVSETLYLLEVCHPWRHFTSSLCWECFRHPFSFGTLSRFSHLLGFSRAFLILYIYFESVSVIFRHASVSRTYPCPLVVWLVSKLVSYTFGFPISGQ